MPDVSHLSVVGQGGGACTTRCGSGQRRPPADAPGIGKPGPRIQGNGASCSSCGASEPGVPHSYMYAKTDSGTGNPADLHHGGLMPVVQAFQACVKVFCTSVAPCYALPWVRGEESHSTSSGFAVTLPSGHRRLLVQASRALRERSGRPTLAPLPSLSLPRLRGRVTYAGRRDVRTLTTRRRTPPAQAQVVENHTLVQVRRASHAQKYVAQVEVVGYDCDLAVLNVLDDQFWRGLPALPLPTGLPQTMSEVLTVGFPAGGEELSTSRGVVNRILLGGPMRELCVQIDPGVQPGQSGGPVFLSNGMLVGMACCSREQNAQLAGYITPMPVIHTFLRNAQVRELYRVCVNPAEIPS